MHYTSQNQLSQQKFQSCHFSTCNQALSQWQILTVLAMHFGHFITRQRTQNWTLGNVFIFYMSTLFDINPSNFMAVIFASQQSKLQSSKLMSATVPNMSNCSICDSWNHCGLNSTPRFTMELGKQLVCAYWSSKLVFFFF